MDSCADLSNAGEPLNAPMYWGGMVRPQPCICFAIDYEGTKLRHMHLDIQRPALVPFARSCFDLVSDGWQ